MNGKWKKILGISAIIAILFGIISYADIQKNVLSAETGEDKLVLYVRNPGEDFEVECQIGTSNCESISVSAITDESIPVETIFLVDNSLSVTKNYRQMITDILTQLAANRMNGEIFTVMTFSDQANLLLEKSSDYAQIKQTIDAIAWEDQETYLTDVLYEVLMNIKNEGDYKLKRIVIVSDGVDNKAIGYTKEELYGLLEAHICPIYTLGCTYKSNNEELKNMFALSRVTGGESWLLDNVSDAMEVVHGISAMNDAQKIVIQPRQEDCDGTTKGVSLKLTSSDQTVQYVLEMSMPFVKKEEISTTAEPTQKAEENMESNIEAEISDLQPVVRSKGSNTVIIIVGIVIMLTIAVGISVVIIRKKSKKNIFKPAPEPFTEGFARETRETRLLNQGEAEQKAEKRDTHYAWGKKLQLTDQNDPMHYFEAYLEEGNEIYIGYNQECQICINYEESVSGKHCNVFEKNGIIMVRNLSHTNPTILNGMIVKGDVELKRGDILTLGRLNMKIGIGL